MKGNVLIMAGGTGGHVFPALACAREFQARGYAVHWLGRRAASRMTWLPKAGLPLHLIQVSGLRGKGLKSLVKAPLEPLKSLFQALRVIRQLRPVCVLGLGGYVTGPGGLAARLNGVPLVIHEQNAVAGTANRSLAPIARRVCEAFPDTFPASDKRLTTGNPVRGELFLDAHARAPLTGRRVNLLVLGGSLGAEPLNKLLPEGPGAGAAGNPSGNPPSGRSSACRDYRRALSHRWRSKRTSRPSSATWPRPPCLGRPGDLSRRRADRQRADGGGIARLPGAVASRDRRSPDPQCRIPGTQRRRPPAAAKSTGAAELAAQLSEVLMHPETLRSMADQARSLAKPEATRTVVDACLEVARG
ncbi:UDP-N-acetylglucosamine--N-acetylmuramyl-(pentapeptide) pyrophosphoryl-undecaprenol N-acetylglucosamine transferase [Pseudomonas aeruginosa]